MPLYSDYYYPSGAHRLWCRVVGCHKVIPEADSGEHLKLHHRALFDAFHGEEYEVQQVIDKKEEGGQVFYKLLWSGYPEHEARYVS